MSQSNQEKLKKQYTLLRNCTIRIYNSNHREITERLQTTENKKRTTSFFG